MTRGTVIGSALGMGPGGRGDPTIFLTRPLSLTLLVLTLVQIVVLPPHVRRKRDEVFVAGD